MNRVVTISIIIPIILVLLSSCSLFEHDLGTGKLESKLGSELENGQGTVTRDNSGHGRDNGTHGSDNQDRDKDKEKGGDKEKGIIINPEGTTIEERFLPLPGFERIQVDENSFGAYLRNLPLKPDGTKVKYYNGKTKPHDVHQAVIDIDVGNRDLQQCADAVMRLRAEYLYGRKMYDKISFNFVCGFKADYATWMQGNRIVVKGNDAYWVKRTSYSDDYESFRQYLDMVFAYAGTESLEKEMKNVNLSDMQIGDIFLKGSLPGHCVIIVDMAENKETGEKLFMIAQSYMPAQDIHILKNNNDKSISPWYSLNFGEFLRTPEWEFTANQLYRFED
ncbi:MAG: DUF4846 domain-containing protein [Clostridiaceae bacterium]|nr:DUF4846 domain-containing protein [Clostridiaceae bacterium]